MGGNLEGSPVMDTTDSNNPQIEEVRSAGVRADPSLRIHARYFPNGGQYNERRRWVLKIK